ncbi:hypothetical protein EUX98_g156 [Antrodiella citrinella]|uniref:Cobalamin-independent methionine synthase MetE C-terminal/archaeal domain-containing protein n=1 Tax=Antrodiella citrinella TaxID=2447956 RepID=A0A4S4N852_9APHY|nr:hypothetical protein EUX98_g156 [Antrodiella citrinella]
MASSQLRTKPPFHAEHVGSLLRPKALLEKRSQYENQQCTKEEFKAAEDAAIATIAWLPYVAFYYAAGLKEVPSVYTTSKIKRTKGVHTEDFKFLKSLVKPEEVKNLKVTIVSPIWLHLRHGSEHTYDPAVYANDEEYFDDLIQAYREEIDELYALGCRNVQFDDPGFCFFCAQSMQDGLAKAGVDAEALIDKYIGVYNGVTKGRPDDLLIAVHMCRGNYKGIHYCEGGYERVAKKLFVDLDVDCYYLEYDTDRAGDFKPLSHLPLVKVAVLGLVTTKHGVLEEASDIKVRVEEAIGVIMEGTPQAIACRCVETERPASATDNRSYNCPPPKVPPKSTRMANADNVADAVREVVTIRRVDPQSPPRNRVARSNTALPPQSTSKPVAPTPRRSASQDSAPIPPEKDKGKSRRTAAKKGSSHADVIDRLDFSGVGPMFHHDGPFDACAPSRNRHRTKAPMYAWSGAPEEDKTAFAAAREIPPSSYASPYPSSPGVYAPYEAPKKKHDAIAEAWGTHEPEPYEDFSAGGGYNPRTSGEFNGASRNAAAGSGASRKPRDKDPREKYREYLDEAQPSPTRRQQARRPNLPPPQPVFAPEDDIESSPPSPTMPASPGAPKRTKSLMHRIRKMRDSPNVPVNYDEVNGGFEDPAFASAAENGVPKPTRPTHRSQNSFLGRLGRGANVPTKEGISPTSDSEQFVYVDDPTRAGKDKSLPATPPVSGGQYPYETDDGFFDSPGGGYATSPGGLGRKTSLLKKMKGVVKGANAK